MQLAIYIEQNRPVWYKLYTQRDYVQDLVRVQISMQECNVADICCTVQLFPLRIEYICTPR